MTDAIRVAVLIDCDNVSCQLGAAVLAEAAGRGTLGVARGYGDWSSQALSGWKQQLPALAVQPMQQPAYVAGKNATDSALIIDAMDLLYSGNVADAWLRGGGRFRHQHLDRRAAFNCAAAGRRPPARRSS